MKLPKLLLVLCALLLAMLSCNLPSVQPADYYPPEISPTEIPPSDDIVPSTDPSLTEPPAPKIVLIGHTGLFLGEMANLIQNQGGFNVQVNTIVPNADLLLVTVNAPDGPMPDLREQFILLEGQTVARAAILLTNIEQLTDPELQQLVMLEIRELISSFSDSSQSNRVEVLHSSDPDLISKIEALLILPPANIQIHAPIVAPTPKIVLIGHTGPFLGEAANLIQSQGGFSVQVNTLVPDADLLLVTVNAPDGPMPGLREQLIFLEGQTVARVAILLTNIEQLNDPELQELEMLEIRELISSFSDSSLVDRFEVLQSSDPDLITKIQAILLLPPINIQFHAPSP